MEGLGGKEEKNFSGLSYFIPSWAGAPEKDTVRYRQRRKFSFRDGGGKASQISDITSLC